MSDPREENHALLVEIARTLRDMESSVIDWHGCCVDYDELSDALLPLFLRERERATANDCPNGEVCQSCPCAAEDDVCFPGERLRAELVRERERADLAAANIASLADWIDVLVKALLDARVHLPQRVLVCMVDAPEAARAARRAAGVVRGPVASAAVEQWDDAPAASDRRPGRPLAQENERLRAQRDEWRERAETAEGERDRAIETRENANTVSVRVEGERDSWRRVAERL